MCSDFSMTALAVDTMQVFSNCVHSNSFPWYPLIPQKFLYKLAKLKKNLKNDIESGCGWLYKIPRSPKNKKNHVLKTNTILGQGCSTFLLLPVALLLFIWSTAANEFELYLWDTFDQRIAFTRYISNCVSYSLENCLWHHHPDCYSSCRLIFLPYVCFASIYASTAAKSYVSNHSWTAANFSIEGYMRPQVVHRCSKLIPVSKSRLPGWIRPFYPLVMAWELGGLASVVTVIFAVRMSRSQRLQASSATRSGRRGGVSERASDWGGEIRRVREVRLSLPANVQRDQVRLRSFRRKCRFEEGRACGFVFLIVSDPSLHLGTSSWFLTTPCFSGLSLGQVWLKYLVTAGNTPWLLWQQLIYK